MCQGWKQVPPKQVMLQQRAARVQQPHESRGILSAVAKRILVGTLAGISLCTLNGEQVDTLPGEAETLERLSDSDDIFKLFAAKCNDRLHSYCKKDDFLL